MRSFNSSLVRLVAYMPDPTEAYKLFQFQLGTISREYNEKQSFLGPEFQFQLGTISSR